MDEIKRLNYFTSQFLEAKDFEDERDYHIIMRRLQNRSFHSWGVVNGLQVSKSATSNKGVSISPGMAIDGTGREIVLVSETTFDLSMSDPDTNYYLTIAYRDVKDPSDRYAVGNVTDFKRITERPLLAAAKTAPPSDGSVVTLARVRLDAAGLITEVNNLVRRLGLGSPGGDHEVRHLIVQRTSTGTPVSVLPAGATMLWNDGTWLRLNQNLDMTRPLRGVFASGLIASDSLNIGGLNSWGEPGAGNVWVKGRVGIGTATPEAELDVAGTLVTNYLRVDAQDATNEGGEIQLKGAGNNPTWTLDVYANRLRLHNTAVAGERLTVDVNGNLGVGTATPTQKLHVGGNALINTTHVGDVGHGSAYAGFSHTGSVGADRYALIQSNDGLYTFMNKKSGDGWLGFRVGNVDKMVINDAGNVGVGTTYPKQRLHISGGKSILESTDSNWAQFQIGNPANNGEASMAFISGATAFGQGPTSLNGDPFLWVIGASIWGIGGNKFAIGNKGTGGPLLTIQQAGGNVGIGTTEPGRKLHIQGTTSAPFITDGNDRPGLAITGTYPELNLFSAVNNGNHGPTIRLGAYNDDNRNTFKHWVIGTAGRNAAFLDIGFSATNDSNPHAGIRNYNGKTIMTLLENGNVGIGVTNPQAILDMPGGATIHSHGRMHISPEENIYLLSKGGDTYVSAAWGGAGRLRVDGDLFLHSARTNLVGFDGSGYHWLRTDGDENRMWLAFVQHTGTRRPLRMESTVPITQPSDARLKTEIREISDVLTKLKKIRGVSFQSLVHSAGQKQIGVIAQEVETVFPELVFSSGEEGYKSVNYSGLTGVLISAVKELISSNEALNKRIDELSTAPAKT